MTNKTKLTFTKKFLWGAATSAHQVEGNNYNQWSVWELEHAKTLAAQSEYQFGDLDNWDEIKKAAKSPDNYVSGVGSDHYNRYQEDFTILEGIGLNAFRFSVEWSRIEPKEGSWDAAAITHYKKYIAELKKRNIEPIMTLFHFTLPVWFSELGGFERRSNIKYFVRFTEKVMQELGANVRYVITINEPEVYSSQSYLTGNWPPNMQNKRVFTAVLNNLAAAHNRAAAAIHTMGRKYKVSIAKNSPYVYAGDDSVLSVRTAKWQQYFKDDYFIKRVVKTCDFFGVNYYFSDRVYGYRVHNPNKHVNDLGWDMAPENIQYVLERLHQKYNLPIMITENGVADSTDTSRKWWLMHTLMAMSEAQKNGVELLGYLHWSLIDNFEWDKGYWPRFGLVEVDSATGSRKLRPSAVWYAKTIKTIRGDS